MRPGSGMIDGATWSPNGSAVAVGGLSAYPFQDHVPWTETLTAYPIHGAKPTVWLRIVNPRSNGCCDTTGLKQSQFIPVGWWAHWGIVFWGPSADIGSGEVGGGFPLFAIPASGHQPIALGSTLAGGQVSTIVASVSGELAISNNPAPYGARPFWQNEQVERCNPTTLTCGESGVSAPGTVSFDPVWSPDGSQLAYLVGKASKQPRARPARHKGQSPPGTIFARFSCGCIRRNRTGRPSCRPQRARLSLSGLPTRRACCTSTTTAFGY